MPDCLVRSARTAHKSRCLNERPLRQRSGLSLGQDWLDTLDRNLSIAESRRFSCDSNARDGAVVARALLGGVWARRVQSRVHGKALGVHRAGESGFLDAVVAR